MRRKVIGILLCLVISVSAVACGNKNTVEESSETEGVAAETTELTEIGDETYWDKVGITDGIGTVYNGETVELIRPDEGYESISGRYEFEEPADFLQFVEADINYQDVNVKVWLLEHKKSRISLSGNYKLEEIGNFNTYGKSYNLIVEGKCIAYFEVEGDSAETPLEECELYCFELYPTEGLELNGFKFTDLQMKEVVDYFGDPNKVIFWMGDSGDQDIIYEYCEDISVTMVESVSCGMSWVDFYTKDGKNIESINISLSLTEEEIIAQREWMEEIQEGETQEEVDSVEEIDNYKELVSVPVEGRDGSQENPYKVGDTIHFPKVMIEYNKESLEWMYTSLTIVVEEATSEYVKISYKFGVDSWEELDWENWQNMTACVPMDNLFVLFRADSEFKQVGNTLFLYTLNDDNDVYIYAADKTGGTLYYQDIDESDGTDGIEDTTYLMLVYNRYSLSEDEIWPYFNCTFVELQ